MYSLFLFKNDNAFWKRVSCFLEMTAPELFFWGGGGDKAEYFSFLEMATHGGFFGRGRYENTECLLSLGPNECSWQQRFCEIHLKIKTIWEAF